jgi:hypothetical protein
VQASPAGDVAIHQQERNLPPPAITRSLIIAEQTEYRGAECTLPVQMFLTNATAG